MNNIPIEQLRKYQDILYKCSDKDIIDIVRQFLNRTDVYYLNTDESIAKYHDKLPLKQFGLSNYITDDYCVIRHGECIDDIQGFSYGKGSDYIEIINGKEKLKIEIGPQFGPNSYYFCWGWAWRHAHYDREYLYDSFITQFITLIRTNKLKSICKKKIKKVYDEIFGYTPLKERLEDIQKQFLNLYRYNDIYDLKNNTGNLITTLVQLCNESGWDVNKLIQENLDLIESRKSQYQTLGRKKRIALYGGAFDPPTKGHMQVAEFVLNTSGVFDEVWFMPANTHMYNKKMSPANDRLKMLELMTAKDGRMKVFDYEIKNNLSGETFKMVKHLLSNSEYENFDFSMIIGQDNANSFDKWVNYKNLETMISFVVVPRKGIERNSEVSWYLNKPHIYLQKESDIMEISSTDVRNIIKDGKPYQLMDLNKYVDIDVINYIIFNKLYL